MVVKRFQYGLPHHSTDSTGNRLIAFLDAELRPGQSHSVRDEYPSLFGEFPGGESLFIESRGVIASHAAFLIREFRNDEGRLKVGLVGSVTTGSPFRGQGMAKAVLAETISELKRQGCVLGLLWSGQPEFYRLMGFFRAGRETDFRFSVSSVPVVGGAVREIDPKTDTHLLWRLYQKHDVRIDRSLEEQKSLMRVPKARVFVTENDGKVTSYIAINKGADFTDYIHEWAGDTKELMRNISLVQRTVFPERSLTLIAPYHYPLDELGQIACRRWDGIMGLVKVLDRGKLLALYRAFLLAKGVSAIWERDEAVTIASERFEIATEEGLIRAVLGGEGAINHPVLPFFLWGFDSI